MEKPNVQQILKMMEQNLGEEPKPMVLMSKALADWVPMQAQERKFVFDLPNIPPKYKHLIMIAVAASVSCDMCTTTFMKLARRAGVTNAEIGEALVTARFALGSTIFAAATEGLEAITKE